MIPMEDLEALANPGWVPLVILVVMFVAVFFLGRSMRRMLRTIDPDLPHKADLEQEEAERGAAGGSVDRARRGQAPAGRATGLVSPTRDDDRSEAHGA